MEHRYSDISLHYADIDIEGLKTSFNNCDAKYLRRNIGSALNECLAELICVRPADPIEYMAQWMYHYADIRNYFKKKKNFYEELLATKIDQEHKKMALIQKHNEAILDITEPLVRPPTADVTDPLNVLPKEEQEQATDEKKSNSQTEGAINENMLSGASDISDNSSISRRQQCPVKGKDVENTGENDELVDDDFDKSSSNRSDVSKNHQEIKAAGDKRRQPKTLRKSSNTANILSQLPRKSKRSVDKNKDEDTGDNESLVNIHYFDVDVGKKISGESLEVMRTKWKVTGNQVVCEHPILGTLSIQGKRYSINYEQTVESVQDFVAQNMYDPELYTHDPTAEEIKFPAGLTLFSSLLADTEPVLRYPSNVSEFTLSD